MDSGDQKLLFRKWRVRRRWNFRRSGPWTALCLKRQRKGSPNPEVACPSQEMPSPARPSGGLGAFSRGFCCDCSSLFLGVSVLSLSHLMSFVWGCLSSSVICGFMLCLLRLPLCLLLSPGLVSSLSLPPPPAFLSRSHTHTFTLFLPVFTLALSYRLPSSRLGAVSARPCRPPGAPAWGGKGFRSSQTNQGPGPS